jgi:hypothetical protein
LFFRPNRRLVKEFSSNLSVGRIWNFSGARKDEWVSPEVFLLLPAQTSVSLNYLFSRETFRGNFFPGIRHYQIYLESRFADPISLTLRGKKIRYIARRVDPPVLGRGWEFETTGSLNLFERLILRPEYTYSELNFADGRKIYAGYVLRTKINYQFTREWFLRLIVQYDSFDRAMNVEPLISCKINPFTIFYLGSSHNYQSLNDTNDFAQAGRQFFFKFQYLLRT